MRQVEFGPASGGCLLLTTADLVLATPLPGGSFSVSLPLPSNPSLVGSMLDSQGAAIVSLSPIAVRTSNANQATLGL